MAIVDSKQKQLGLAEIIHEGLTYSGELQKYPPAVGYAAIIKELSLPKTVYRLTGNTLWIFHTGDDRKCVMRAINADTAENLLQHSREIARWAYDDLGLDYMQTQFKGGSFLNIFRMIAKNPVREEMAYQSFKMRSGDTMVLLKLGPERN